MSMRKLSPLCQELLTPPSPFVREDKKASLYILYSRKLRRRVHVYRRRGYALVVHLEWDTTVYNYNVLVRPHHISMVGETRASEVAPSAVSLDASGTLTVHTMVRQSPDDDAGGAERFADVWPRWCEEHGFKHIAWTPELLLGNAVELENRQQLLRMASRLGVATSLALMDALLAELRRHRTLTFYALARSLPAVDIEATQAAIAALMIDGRIYSTIAFEPFQNATELSAFHAFEA